MKLGEIEVRCTLVRHDAQVVDVKGNAKLGFNPEPDKKLSEKCLKGRAMSNRVS